MLRTGTRAGASRVTLGALALFVLTVLSSSPAPAQESIELTMMYHGSTGGKIAPCG